MKTAISMPDDLFRAVEQLARRSKKPRSVIVAKAVEEYLKRHREQDITEQLNRVYAKVDSSLDPVLAKLQSASLPEEEW